MIPPEAQAQWEKDCKRWHGHVLTGKLCHWCVECDGLPVDDTCEELRVCMCFPDDVYPDWCK